MPIPIDRAAHSSSPSPVSPFASGLDGLVLLETRLSDVDGERGRLVIAGADVERWAFEAGFEQVTGALWEAAGAPCPELSSALGAARLAAFGDLGRLDAALAAGTAMDALRACVASLPSESSAERVLGALPVYLGAFYRRRQGLAPIAPHAERSHAADTLALLGLESSEAKSRALDRYLVTVSDHGLNASTFAARVVASTGSDRVSCVAAGIGALKGPLHGGAPGPVLDMLDAVARRGSVRGFLEAELAAGRRIMGMGHRVYRVRDPRGAVLERALRALWAEQFEHSAAEQPARRRLELAREVEREAERLLAERHPERPLRANVEFFTALLLEALGIPRELFSAIFAVSRTAGWLAHVEEQRRHGRLMRPLSRYTGPLPAGGAGVASA